MINHDEIYRHHWKKQDGTCPACNDLLLRYQDPITIQHRYPKPRQGREAKRVQRELPDFINSTFNTCLVHLSCNTTKHRSYGRITEYRAKRLQARMTKYPSLAKRANWPITIQREREEKKDELFLWDA